MTNKIHNVAIHDLNRTSGGFVVKLGNPSLKVTATMQRVVNELYDLYSRRASKSYGKFSTDVNNYPTQNHLREYVNGGFTTFADFSAELMKTLSVQAGHRNAAVGGHVFFAHFERDAKQYVLVAIITDKLGAALTTNYDLRDAEYLDMEGFRFAGRINMTGWLNGEERYIGFLKGRGNVSEYFKEFLGCDDMVQARKDTSDLVSVLKKFTEDENMPQQNKDEFLSKAKTICDRYARSREELEFQALANELMPLEPEKLLDVLTHPDLLLNDRFVPDRRALGSLVKFKGKTALWSIEFEREALSGGNIHYDPLENTLTVKDVPSDLAAELKNEMLSEPDATPQLLTH